MLSAILELPTDENTACILARYFPDPDNVNPEIQDRLRWILNDWHRLFISEVGESESPRGMTSESPRGMTSESPRGMTSESPRGMMSESPRGMTSESPRGMTMHLCYYKHARDSKRSMKNKQKLFKKYEEQIFSEENQQGVGEVGSRPFESSREYLEFLERFFDLCFTKVLVIADQNAKPLLNKYFTDIRRHEFDRLPTEVFPGLDFEQPVSIKNSKSFPSQKKLNTVLTTSVKPAKGSVKKMGLFRSLSVNDAGRKSSNVPQWIGSKNSPMVLNILAPIKRSRSESTLRGRSFKDVSQLNRNNSNNKDTRKRKSRNLNNTTSDFQSGSVGSLLAHPVVASLNLEHTEFEREYAEVECLARWLTIWSSRNRTAPHKFSNNLQTNSSTAIKVKITPKLLVYSLWLIDNCLTSKHKPVMRSNHEITVAMVQDSDDDNKSDMSIKRKSKKTVQSTTKISPARSPLRELNEDEHMSEDDKVEEEIVVTKSKVGERTASPKRTENKVAQHKEEVNKELYSRDSEQSFMSCEIPTSTWGSQRVISKQGMEPSLKLASSNK